MAKTAGASGLLQYLIVAIRAWGLAGKLARVERRLDRTEGRRRPTPRVLIFLAYHSIPAQRAISPASGPPDAERRIKATLGKHWYR